MLSWFNFLLMTAIGYCILLLIIAFCTLPKFRSNCASYFCRMQVEPDQLTDMSEQELEILRQAKKTAEERKETECAICMEQMNNKKIVLLCSHAYCVFCIINVIKSKNNRQIECPTCRQPVKFMSIHNNIGLDESQRFFIKTYNRRFFAIKGAISYIENLPFVTHRFFCEIYNSCGLTLLEQPGFYIICLVLFSNIWQGSDSIGSMIAYALEWFDDLGVVAFILLSLAGNLISWIRERRIRNEVVHGMQN